LLSYFASFRAQIVSLSVWPLIPSTSRPSLPPDARQTFRQGQALERFWNGSQVWTQNSMLPTGRLGSIRLVNSSNRLPISLRFSCGWLIGKKIGIKFVQITFTSSTVNAHQSIIARPSLQDGSVG
jgi:hypothetical protein